MSTNASASRSTVEKRNELSRKTIRGATHEVGIFIGLLFAADKVHEIWSRSPVLSYLIIVAALLGFIYLITVRASDLKDTFHLVNELADAAGSETSTDNGGD